MIKGHSNIWNKYGGWKLNSINIANGIIENPKIKIAKTEGPSPQSWFKRSNWQSLHELLTVNPDEYRSPIPHLGHLLFRIVFNKEGFIYLPHQ